MRVGLILMALQTTPFPKGPPQIGDRVRCRSPYLTVQSVFKTVAEAARLTLPHGTPRKSRTLISRSVALRSLH